MAFTVVYDACTLYPAPLRDLLLRLAQSGIVRARWSERILDECFRSIAADRPDLSPFALQRTRILMCAAVAEELACPTSSWMVPMTDTRITSLRELSRTRNLDGSASRLLLLGML